MFAGHNMFLLLNKLQLELADIKRLKNSYFIQPEEIHNLHFSKISKYF